MSTPPQHTPDNYRDWIVNVTLEEHALGASGQVSFFCGPESEIPSNAQEAYKSPIFVGSYSIYTAPGSPNRDGQRVGGTVHLTKTLIKNHVALTGNKPVEYLTENLHWRCYGIKGLKP